MKIGEKTLKKGGELLTNSLLTYQHSINDAFVKTGEKKLSISLGLEILPGPGGNGNFKLTSKIKFMLDQIEDTFSDSVDEMQTKLSFDEPTKVCPKRENGDEIFISVCEKCRDRESVILIDGKNLPVWKGHKEPIDTPKEGYQMVQFMPCSAWADDDYKAWCDGMIRRADIMIAGQEEAKKEKPVEKKRMKKAA